MTYALHPIWDNNVLYGPTSSGLEDEREVEYLNKGGKEIRNKNKNRHDNSLKYKVTKKGCKIQVCRVSTTPMVFFLKDFTCYVLQFDQKGRNPVWWSLLAFPHRV